jgi:hypothetical protein
MSQDRTSKIRRACPEQGRRDGWTPERQLRFLDALARTRSVTRAAAAAGMSRETAYRLRGRRDGALFAAAWDRALEGHALIVRQKPEAPKSRANPPKVTKWKKWKNPGFQSLLNQLRDLKEPAPCPSAPEACPDNPACSAAPCSRDG